MSYFLAVVGGASGGGVTPPPPPSAPVITSQPSATNLSLGPTSSATISVTATEWTGVELLDKDGKSPFEREIYLGGINKPFGRMSPLQRTQQPEVCSFTYASNTVTLTINDPYWYQWWATRAPWKFRFYNNDKYVFSDTVDINISATTPPTFVKQFGQVEVFDYLELTSYVSPEYSLVYGADTFQWKKDGVNVPPPEGTSPSISFSTENGNTPDDTKGNYSITASNAHGSSSVNCPVYYEGEASFPVISQQRCKKNGFIQDPPSHAYCSVGETFAVEVVAGGTGPFTYEWFVRDRASPTWQAFTGTGSSTNQISVVASLADNRKQYMCRVSNSSGATETVSFGLFVI